MNEGLYDHCPAIINWENGEYKSRRQFKYYNMWTLEPDFKENVKKSWEDEITRDRLFQVVGKMNRLKALLLKLNKEIFSDIERKANQAMEELKQCQLILQGDLRNKALIEKEIQLAKECEIWGEARNQFLRQKSRVQWLTQGETKNDPEEIAKAFIEFYKNLLGKRAGRRQHMCNKLVREGPTINQEQRDWQEQGSQENDVKVVVWAIAGDKPQGLTNMVVNFIKTARKL
ncbi:uncharacterized protein [Nicotiana sylvestris]|uniref:uncharacterized protein n=1 Tax=Nicotiana sylvestris TaxID=4096 RepID=UPI00388C829C